MMVFPLSMGQILGFTLNLNVLGVAGVNHVHKAASNIDEDMNTLGIPRILRISATGT